MFTRLLYICLLTVPLYSNAQTGTIDALKRKISASSDNAEKLSSLFALCELGYNLHPDTLLNYAVKAKEIGLRLNDPHAAATALYYESSAFTAKGNIDTSLAIANKCLELLSHQVNDPALEANVYNQMGRCYMRKNQYKEAIGMAYKVIAIAERINDPLLQVKGKTLVGWAYLEMGLSKEALTWHLSALHVTTDTLLLEKYAVLFGNLALNYNSIGKTDSGFYYIDKAIYAARKHENLFALSNALAIQAQLFVRSGKPALAEAPLKEVVQIRKLIGDPFYIVSDMSQLSLYYAHNGQPQKGIELCNEGIAIAKQYRMDTKLFFLYSTLAENYKAFGNTARYAEILEKIIALKDSVYQANSADALAEMQTRYDLQKKENVIISQKLDIVLRNYWLYGFLWIVALGIIVSVVLFKNYRRRQKLIFHTVREEEKHIATQAVIAAEENERKRISADLHDNMGAYASALIANVDEMMQSAGHPDTLVLQHLKSNAGEIMNNLRDTIWASNKERILLTGISDRFKNYMQKITPAFPNISADMKEDISNDLSFSPAHALNLFRILQEAFTNALRHSGGSMIIVSFTSKEYLRINVSDNGKSISGPGYSRKGNGINNMKARAAESGWNLSISKSSLGGVEVVITALRK